MTEENTQDNRKRFVEMLTELASGLIDREKWQKLVVTHYHDELLEPVRVRLVRFSIEAERQLTELIRELRAGSE